MRRMRRRGDEKDNYTNYRTVIEVLLICVNLIGLWHATSLNYSFDSIYFMSMSVSMSIYIDRCNHAVSHHHDNNE